MTHCERECRVLLNPMVCGFTLCMQNGSTALMHATGNNVEDIVTALDEHACMHVAALSRAMVHLVIWRFRASEGAVSDGCRIKEVWSASAFMLCGKRKLALTAKHNVEGVDQRDRGGIFAYTHPQDAVPHGGKHFATVVGFIGNIAVLELCALHSDSDTTNKPLHAVKLATVEAKHGDKIRVVGIASVKRGDSATRILAPTPGMVTLPGSHTRYRQDGLVPCDLTMFEGLSGGAITMENGCVVAFAEGVDSHSGRMAFATDLVGLRGELERVLRTKYNCGIGDLVTDDPVSWAVTKVRKEELSIRVRSEMQSVSAQQKWDNKARVAEAEAARCAKAAANADILKSRIRARVREARRHFTGRNWLAKQLVHSLGRVAPRKAVLITGTGGTGKSFFFNRLLDTVACTSLGGDWAWLNRRILARHCCIYKYSDSLDAIAFLDSLVGQLLTAVTGTGRIFTLDDKDKTPVSKMLCDHLTTPKYTEARAIVAEVLLPALKAVGGANALGGRCVILVDSLDEAQCGGDIVSVFVDLVAKSPEWLQWVATSRPDAAVRRDLAPVEGGSIELGLEPHGREARRQCVDQGLERRYSTRLDNQQEQFSEGDCQRREGCCRLSPYQGTNKDIQDDPANCSDAHGLLTLSWMDRLRSLRSSIRNQNITQMSRALGSTANPTSNKKREVKTKTLVENVLRADECMGPSKFLAKSSTNSNPTSGPDAIQQFCDSNQPKRKRWKGGDISWHTTRPSANVDPPPLRPDTNHASHGDDQLHDPHTAMTKEKKRLLIMELIEGGIIDEEDVEKKLLPLARQLNKRRRGE